LVKKYLLTEMS